MADIAKLKKKALEHEQKKQPDKALALYIQILEESAGASADEVDVSLYNRVGDLLVKQGNVGDADDDCFAFFHFGGCPLLRGCFIPVIGAARRGG